MGLWGSSSKSASSQPTTPTSSQAPPTPSPLTPPSPSDLEIIGGAHEQQQAARSRTNGTSSSSMSEWPRTSQELIDGFDNQTHIKLDYLVGTAAYAFGGAMHVAAQSTMLATVSMWTAGTCFFMNAQLRKANGPTADVFHYEAIGSWVWMLTSFQQFKQYKVLKYAGYSSWAGLGCVSYYSFRHILNWMTS